MPYIINEDDIKRRADVVQIIGRRVPLKPGSSRDHLEGSCPFHSSKSGKSFHVYPDKQSWWCWGCMEGGTIANFLMKLDGLTYPEALEVMAQESGVIVQYDESHAVHADKPKGPKRQDMSSCLEMACQHYQKELAKNQQAIEYLAKRGFGQNIIERWRIGYAHGDSVKEVAIPELLVASGVMKIREKDDTLYDPLAGRITIPITDHAGHVLGFTARLMEAAENRPKYLNTSETPIFHKGKALFGLAQSRQLLKANPRLALHIVEGQFKAIACVENGLPAVAPGGTAFTPEHAALIHSVADVAAWCPDPDEAGAAAVLKGAPIARDAGLTVWIGQLVIPDSITEPIKDPDDLMAMGLPVRYEYQTPVEWLYARVCDGPVRTEQEARRVATEIVPFIDKHPVPAVRLIELRKLSELSGIPESRLSSATSQNLVLPAPRMERPQQEERPVIDTAMPPERLLFSAVLWQGWTVEWQKLIPWCDLTAAQWGVLANIKHCLGYAGKYGLSLADGIATAAKDRLRDYLMYWATVPEGRTADIASLAAQVAKANREQAALLQVQAGNFEYASYLKEG